MRNYILKGILLFIMLSMLITVIFLPLVGFGKKNNSSETVNENPKTTFCFVGHGPYHSFQILYNQETKVMYALDSEGRITVMVNSDGTPMLWEE